MLSVFSVVARKHFFDFPTYTTSTYFFVSGVQKGFKRMHVLKQHSLYHNIVVNIKYNFQLEYIKLFKYE